MPKSLFQPVLCIYQLFTFKQHIPKFSQDTLTYSISKSLKTDVVLLQLGEKCNSHEKQFYFSSLFFYCRGVKTLSRNDICYNITQTLKEK